MQAMNGTLIRLLTRWRNYTPMRSSSARAYFFSARSEQLGALALRHAVPAIFQYGPFARAGGLLSYGTDETEYYHLVGFYTGRILQGEKPGDLPVQRSTKIELIINLKTAKALGITIPLSLLARADEVIE
jgi:putative ABC transport system substrate-binding protein